MQVQGDLNQFAEFEDPQGPQGDQQSLSEILHFYKKGEYFVTGAPTNDASDNYFKQYLEGEKEKKKKYLEGTIMGVFFPVMNNIFGVLLFIRQPSLTAEAGLGQFLLIVFICCFCTFSTSVSLAALCSNGRMSTGGSYFLFSRALGAPLGTAIGFCFWFATTVGAAQYILGVAETYIQVGWPVPIDTGDKEGDFSNNVRVVGFIVFSILLTINLFGLKYVSQAGIIFLILVFMGIVMAFLGIGVSKYDPKLQTATETGFDGLSHQHCKDNWEPQWKENDFFKAMGIYFPAVTGILAGSNRSGDLKNPSVSIPRGTLAAQLISSLTYLSLSVLYGCGADRDTLLRGDVMVVVEAAWPRRELMALAMMMSSAGAAIENIAGAPRLLFAMATDGNLKFLNRFQGKFKFLMCCNSVITILAIMIAKIDFINPINTMFFLIPYGTLNFVTLFSDILEFPNWRPQYNYYNKLICLVGVILCLVMAILISQWYCFAALFFQIVIYFYVKKNCTANEELRLKNSFGDLFDAFFMKIASVSLNRLIQSKQHVKNWIPSTLIIGEISTVGKIEGKGALSLVESIKSDCCLNVYGFIHKATLDAQNQKDLNTKEKFLKNYFDEQKITFLTKCIQLEPGSSSLGISYLIQASGMAGLEPNTIVSPFPEGYREDQIIAKRFYEIIQQGVLMGKAIIITKQDESFIQKVEYQGNIDLFSFSYEKGLILMIPYFLKRTKQWKKCNIRLFIVTLKTTPEEDESREKEFQQQIKEFLARYRLFPTIKVNIILLSPNEIENFILQEYQSFLIQKKRQELLAREKPKIKDGDSKNSEKDFNDHSKIEQIAVQLNQTHENVQESLSEKTSHKQSELDYKVPEKFLSTTFSKGNNLNKLLLLHCKDSDLVILNLPAPINQDPVQYLDYLRVLTSGLKKTLFIKNESQEVITEYS